MTNLKGIRIYRESISTTPVSSLANKDVSSLAIIAPFRVTIRARIFWNHIENGDNGTFVITITYGGASDNLTHNTYLYALSNSNLDQLYVTNDSSVENSSITTITQEDWIWMELEVDTDRNLIGKVKDDNTTTRPTTWDATKTHSAAINATPEQQLQQVEVAVTVDKSSSSGSAVRGIFEIDEIYVTQD